MSNIRFFSLLCVLVVAACLAVAAISNRWLSNTRVVDSKDTPDEVALDSTSVENAIAPAGSSSLADALGLEESDFIEVGGVRRPKRDVAEPREYDSESNVMRSPLPKTGSLPTLRGDENPQVASLFAELKQADDLREAKSAMYLPKKEFNKQKYLEDPAEYLNKIRPGRVFKPAVPAPGVIPIAAASPRKTTVLQSESAILRVKAEPNYPVTFYTPDGGEFQNRLKTISVSANEEGIAQAKYTAVSGTHGLIDIVASSPLHSGLARFVVKVELPED